MEFAVVIPESVEAIRIFSGRDYATDFEKCISTDLNAIFEKARTGPPRVFGEERDEAAGGGEDRAVCSRVGIPV